MGQRLVVNIKKNEEILANCYWHWSGFTDGSYEIISELLRQIDTVVDKETAVKCFNIVGATRTTDDKADRNNGLIETENDAMYNSLRWAEQYCTIDLDTRIIDLKNLYWIENKEEFLENHEDEEYYILDNGYVSFEEYLELSKTPYRNYYNPNEDMYYVPVG